MHGRIASGGVAQFVCVCLRGPSSLGRAIRIVCAAGHLRKSDRARASQRVACMHLRSAKPKPPKPPQAILPPGWRRQASDDRVGEWWWWPEQKHNRGIGRAVQALLCVPAASAAPLSGPWKTEVPSPRHFAAQGTTRASSGPEENFARRGRNDRWNAFWRSQWQMRLLPCVWWHGNAMR